MWVVTQIRINLYEQYTEMLFEFHLVVEHIKKKEAFVQMKDKIPIFLPNVLL